MSSLHSTDSFSGVVGLTGIEIKPPDLNGNRTEETAPEFFPKLNPGAHWFLYALGKETATFEAVIGRKMGRDTIAAVANDDMGDTAGTKAEEYVRSTSDLQAIFDFIEEFSMTIRDKQEMLSEPDCDRKIFKLTNKGLGYNTAGEVDDSKLVFERKYAKNSRRIELTIKPCDDSRVFLHGRELVNYRGMIDIEEVKSLLSQSGNDVGRIVEGLEIRDCRYPSVTVSCGDSKLVYEFIPNGMVGMQYSRNDQLLERQVSPVRNFYHNGDVPLSHRDIDKWLSNTAKELYDKAKVEVTFKK